ncbi:MAG TPA: hypothetical protein VFO77_00590 [Actinoplanes sp.]|nr:hypothetical protein [Actinoplanes sp.]
MNTQTTPEIGADVELTAADEAVRGVRVVTVADTRLILSLPPDTPVVVDRGDRVGLRWAAGERGCYRATARVAEAAGSHLVVELTGAAQLEQHRRFVRGGGGEQVRIRPRGSVGGAETSGWIRDISERALRAAFPAVPFGDDDVLHITVELDDDVIEVWGVAARITVRPPERPGPANTAVEVLAMIDPTDAQAQVIRRYLLRQQALTRARTAA